MTADEVEQAGWLPSRSTGPFSDVTGPFWSRREGAVWRHAVLADLRHTNSGGVVHGGLLVTFADHAMGITVWEQTDQAPVVTIQLDMQFIDAVRPGDFVELDATVIRTTRSIVFMRGSLTVAGRTVAVANGIWKVLATRT